jgi:alpha-tubulin suppressor-like RCC1 family protein
MHAAGGCGDRSISASSDSATETGDGDGDGDGDGEPDVYAVALAAGNRLSCALTNTGGVRCWGWSPGYGVDQHVPAPAQYGDIELGEPAIAISANQAEDWGFGGTVCALLQSGAVRCWGTDKFSLGLGQRWDGPLGDDETPLAVEPIDVGGEVFRMPPDASSCVIYTDGRSRCWGWGLTAAIPELVDETLGVDEPVAALPFADWGADVVSLARSISHVCALLDSAEVRCWGVGGALGSTDYYENASAPPAQWDTVAVGGPVVQIDVGSNVTCAVLTSGAVRCWGNGFQIGLGHGNEDSIGVPGYPSVEDAGDIPLDEPAISVSVGDVANIGLGGIICAVLESGAVRCWGGPNTNGQLGVPLEAVDDSLGDDELVTSVPPVALDEPATQVAVGVNHACALLESGRIRCWGKAEFLGYDATQNIGDDEEVSEGQDVDLF